MGKIATMEYFRVPPRWLFVKITDEDGNVGWGEATLEGHTQAVEGCLDAWFERYTGFEADDIEHIWQMSWRTTFYRGGPVFMSALAGIDIALWDLKGWCPVYSKLFAIADNLQHESSVCQFISYWEARSGTSCEYTLGSEATGRTTWLRKREPTYRDKKKKKKGRVGMSR